MAVGGVPEQEDDPRRSFLHSLRKKDRICAWITSSFISNAHDDWESSMDVVVVDEDMVCLPLSCMFAFICIFYTDSFKHTVNVIYFLL